MGGTHTPAVHTCLERSCGHEIKAPERSRSPVASEYSDNASASVDDVPSIPEPIHDAQIPPWQRDRKPTGSGRRDAVKHTAPATRPAVPQPPLPVKPLKIEIEKSQRLYALATDYNIPRWQVKLDHGWANFYDEHQEPLTVANNQFLSDIGPATLTLSVVSSRGEFHGQVY
jgi:hypothetical protein